MTYHSRRKNIWQLLKGSKKTCYFTDNKVKKIDWKDVDLLKRFVSDRGKILPRRITGTKAYLSKRTCNSY